MKASFYTVCAVVIACVLPSVASAATLSVSPSSQTVKTGDTFTVTVQLDTQGSSIDGVDIRYLSYNPALMQVQDAVAATPGIQIAPGTLMPSTLLNSVDNASGRIAFSQVAMGGTKYSGSGRLATITFKALAAGTANLTFGYTSQSTTDSNIAAAGADILNAVINGSYVIQGAAVSVTTPTPRVTEQSTTKPVVRVPVTDATVADQEPVSSSVDTVVSDSVPPSGSIADFFRYIIDRILRGVSRIFGGN